MRDWQGWETAWNQRDEGGEPGGGCSCRQSVASVQPSPLRSSARSSHAAVPPGKTSPLSRPGTSAGLGGKCLWSFSSCLNLPRQAGRASAAPPWPTGRPLWRRKRADSAGIRGLSPPAQTYFKNIILGVIPYHHTNHQSREACHLVFPNPVPRGASWQLQWILPDMYLGVKAQTHANAPRRGCWRHTADTHFVLGAR